MYCIPFSELLEISNDCRLLFFVNGDFETSGDLSIFELTEFYCNLAVLT